MNPERDGITCCAADALQQARMVEVGGVIVGLKMFDEVFAEVAALENRDDTALGAELVSRVREHNYIPPGAMGLYATAPVKEFHSGQR